MQLSRPYLPFLAFFCLWPATLPAAIISWNEHVDEWSDPLKWSPAVVPGAGDSVFLGNEFDGQDDHIDVDIAAHAGALTISEFGTTQIADVIDINNSRSLSIHGGGILNDGHILLSGTSSTTRLRFVGTGPGGIPQVIAGRGEIVLSDSLSNIIDTNAGDVVIQHGNGFGHVIRGAGRLLNNTGGMINKGVIRAEGTNALIIDPNGLGFANDNGTLEAAANSTLRLESGVFTQSNFGSIVTLAPSAVVEISNATVIDGSLGGTGTITPSSATLDGVVVGSQITVEHNNGVLNTINNGLTLNGIWNLNGGASDTRLRFSGTQTLTGSGEVVLTDTLKNFIDVATSAQVLTIDSGITVRGAGRLMNNTGGLMNLGTINATGANALIVDTNGLGLENQGSLLATGGGGLSFQEGYTQTAGLTGVDTTLTVITGTTAINGGVLGGSGVVNGNVSVGGTGQVNPGSSPGTLTVNGTYTQSTGGELLIEIASLSVFDLLDVNGVANLGGVLDVALLGGFAPGIGSTFDVLMATSIVGAFDNSTVMLGGFEFAISYLSGVEDIVRLTTTASAVPVPPAIWFMFSALSTVFGLTRRPR